MERENDLVLRSIMVSQVTLYNDPTGLALTLLTSAELGASRRILEIDWDFVRAQFSISLNSVLISCRIDGSKDGGASWAPLIPTTSASGIADGNTLSDWIDVPPDFRGETLVRVWMSGNGLLSPAVRYVTIQGRSGAA